MCVVRGAWRAFERATSRRAHAMPSNYWSVIRTDVIFHLSLDNRTVVM